MRTMVPNKKSILVCALLLMSPASLIRIDMEAARKVGATQNKLPNHVALGQSEVRTAAREGDQARGSTLVYNKTLAAENYHSFHWFKRFRGQAQKAFLDWHGKQQQTKANNKCEDKCSGHKYYADCTNCISRIYNGARVQAQILYASIPQCHCHMLSGQS